MEITNVCAPGKFEFVKAGDVPMMGTTKLTPENIKILSTKKFLGGNPFLNKPKGAIGTGETAYRPENDVAAAPVLKA